MNLKQKLLTTLSFIGCASIYAQNKPNILIILLDDAGYSSFGFNGAKDIESPCIDALAQNGVICTDAHVMGSVSAPSRAALMTGRYGQRFGFECNLDAPDAGIPHEEETLGDIFQKAGYRTAALGKWHLGNLPDMHPNAQGFDYFYGFIAGSRSYFYHPENDDAPNSLQKIEENGKASPFKGYLTDVLTEKAIKYINQNKEHPFMMYLAYNAIHTPMEATQTDLDRFAGHKRQKIAAMTFAVDRGIGQLITYLKHEKLFENTLIFFLTDNGGAINNLSSNLPYKGFKGNKFEGGHRVPFFITWGNKLKQVPKHFNGLISSLDIMATAISAADISKKSLTRPIDGVDLIPYLVQQKQGTPHQILFWRKMGASAIRTPKYKRIEVKGIGTVLYDMNKDPYETHNIINQKPEVDKKLKEKYKNWEKQMIPRRWNDGGEWPQITDTIHLDLMNNKVPRKLMP